MRIKMRFNTAFATVIFLCLLFVTPTAGATAIAQPAASADGITVQEIVTENGDHYVRYPQIAGLADPAIQQAINDDIVNSAKIAQRLIAQPQPTKTKGPNHDYIRQRTNPRQAGRRLRLDLHPRRIVSILACSLLADAADPPNRRLRWLDAYRSGGDRGLAWRGEGHQGSIQGVVVA